MITKAAELATIASFCCTAPTAFLALLIAVVQLRDIKKQLKQTTDHLLATLSNEHNWDLFERHDDLPPANPSWAGLSSENKGWAWRTLIINHLNLLHLAYKDHQRKLMSDDEFIYWKRRARFWFEEIAKESPDPLLSEGRKVLRQVLSRREAIYSDEFRGWLVKVGIAPADLLAETEAGESN